MAWPIPGIRCRRRFNQQCELLEPNVEGGFYQQCELRAHTNVEGDLINNVNFGAQCRMRMLTAVIWG